MRKTNRKHIPRVAFVTAFLLIASLDSQPTIPSIPENRPAPPSPEEVMVLEELLEWVGGGPHSFGLRSAAESDLASTVLSRPRSFHLFRTFAAEEARRRLIEDLPYGHLIRRAARRHQVDGLLVAAVMEAESGFDPSAISVDGAQGLMQIMPSTALHFGHEEYLEPAVNVEIGTRYLSWLLRLFDGDVALALAAYNAGPGNVSRFDGVPPFGETRRYLERVLTRYVDHHQQLWRQTGAQAWLTWDDAARDDGQTPVEALASDQAS